MEKQWKPDWITDEQWKVNPNVYHWVKEAEEQVRRDIIQLGADSKVYEDFLKEQDLHEKTSTDDAEIRKTAALHQTALNSFSQEEMKLFNLAMSKKNK